MWLRSFVAINLLFDALGPWDVLNLDQTAPNSSLSKNTGAYKTDASL